MNMNDHVGKEIYDEVMKQNIRKCNSDHGCMITLSESTIKEEQKEDGI